MATKPPLKTVFTSEAFLSLLMTHISYAWLQSIFGTYLPIYLNDILLFDTETVSNSPPQRCPPVWNSDWVTHPLNNILIFDPETVSDAPPQRCPPVWHRDWVTHPPQQYPPLWHRDREWHNTSTMSSCLTQRPWVTPPQRCAPVLNRVWVTHPPQQYPHLWHRDSEWRSTSTMFSSLTHGPWVTHHFNDVLLFDTETVVSRCAPVSNRDWVTYPPQQYVCDGDCEWRTTSTMSLVWHRDREWHTTSTMSSCLTQRPWVTPPQRCPPVWHRDREWHHLNDILLFDTETEWRTPLNDILLFDTETVSDVPPQRCPPVWHRDWVTHPPQQYSPLWHRDREWRTTSTMSSCLKQRLSDTSPSTISPLWDCEWRPLT